MIKKLFKWMIYASLAIFGFALILPTLFNMSRDELIKKIDAEIVKSEEKIRIHKNKKTARKVAKFLKKHNISSFNAKDKTYSCIQLPTGKWKCR